MLCHHAPRDCWWSSRPSWPRRPSCPRPSSCPTQSPPRGWCLCRCCTPPRTCWWSGYRQTPAIDNLTSRWWNVNVHHTFIPQWWATMVSGMVLIPTESTPGKLIQYYTTDNTVIQCKWWEYQDISLYVCIIGVICHYISRGVGLGIGIEHVAGLVLSTIEDERWVGESPIGVYCSLLMQTTAWFISNTFRFNRRVISSSKLR